MGQTYKQCFQTIKELVCLLKEGLNHDLFFVDVPLVCLKFVADFVKKEIHVKGLFNIAVKTAVYGELNKSFFTEAGDQAEANTSFRIYIA